MYEMAHSSLWDSSGMYRSEETHRYFGADTCFEYGYFTPLCGDATVRSVVWRGTEVPIQTVRTRCGTTANSVAPEVV